MKGANEFTTSVLVANLEPILVSEIIRKSFLIPVASQRISRFYLIRICWHFTVRIIILLMRVLWRLVNSGRRCLQADWRSKVLSDLTLRDASECADGQALFPLRFVSKKVMLQMSERRWQVMLVVGWLLVKYRLKPAFEAQLVSACIVG